MLNDRRRRDRRRDGEHMCALSAEQAQALIDNQADLVRQMALLQIYLFAGRIAFIAVTGIGAFVFWGIGWAREHAALVKLWLLGG